MINLEPLHLESILKSVHMLIVLCTCIYLLQCWSLKIQIWNDMYNCYATPAFDIQNKQFIKFMPEQIWILCDEIVHSMTQTACSFLLTLFDLWNKWAIPVHIVVWEIRHYSTTSQNVMDATFLQWWDYADALLRGVLNNFFVRGGGRYKAKTTII